MPNYGVSAAMGRPRQWMLESSTRTGVIVHRENGSWAGAVRWETFDCGAVSLVRSRVVNKFLP